MSAATRSISPPPAKRRHIWPTMRLAPTVPTKPLTDLLPDHLRIFSWNVNGIAPFTQKRITAFFKPSRSDRKRSLSPEPSGSETGQCYDLRVRLRSWNWPQIVCFQEVKIAPKDSSTRDAIRRSIRKPIGSGEPAYQVFFNLPRDRYNARGFGGKVYGVATFVRDDAFQEFRSSEMEVSVEPVDWDLEGRVLVTKLPRPRVLVVNVYAVNGTDNPYRNSQTGHEEGTRHDHKRAFHTYLRNMVSHYEGNGWSVVVAGDLNIARSPLDGYPGIRLSESHMQNRADFDAKFMKANEAGGLGMIDSFRQLHGAELKYTYRSPSVPWGASCDRVDLILLSSHMHNKAKSLIEADILDDPEERGPSDHLPLYVTLRLE